MPIYMDRHDLPGVTAKDVAEAHQEDLKIQDKFGCRGLTYWFDEERGMAFCLVEAPDKKSVEEMHYHAHGLIPHQIIEVDNNLVEAFLGRIEDPESSSILENSESTFLNETALRTIMTTDLKESAFYKSKFGENKAIKLFGIHNDIIRTQINRHHGREVDVRGNGFMASFASNSKAVLCALEIQRNIKNFNNQSSGEKLQIGIGLSAGIPLTEKYDFFGQTVLLAKRLCYLAEKGQIIVSTEVYDLYKREDISIFSNRSNIKILSPIDENFLNHLMDIIDRYWVASDFSVTNFCKEIGLSKSQLYRKITSLTGHSLNDFIKEFRLSKAVELIEKKKGNIAEIAYESGFTSPSYFSKCFQKKFDIRPSSYASLIH